MSAEEKRIAHELLCQDIGALVDKIYESGKEDPVDMGQILALVRFAARVKIPNEYISDVVSALQRGVDKMRKCGWGDLAKTIENNIERLGG